MGTDDRIVFSSNPFKTITSIKYLPLKKKKKINDLKNDYTLRYCDKAELLKRVEMLFPPFLN